MKTGCLKLAALLGYLGLILIFTGLQWKRFVSARILLLVVAGTLFLSIPELLEKRRQFLSGASTRILTLARILEKQSISAGLLLSFLLLFSDSSQTAGSPAGIYQAALCFRPLFYGYCIHILLYVEKPATKEPLDDRTAAPENAGITTEEIAARLRKLGLTNRESEIAMYILHGQGNGEIASALTISEATVKKHVSNIFQKLNISRREQIAEALREVH